MANTSAIADIEHRADVGMIQQGDGVGRAPIRETI
jgi:hypothetical protein